MQKFSKLGAEILHCCVPSSSILKPAAQLLQLDFQQKIFLPKICFEFNLSNEMNTFNNISIDSYKIFVK